MRAEEVDDCLRKLDPLEDHRRCDDVAGVDLGLGKSQSNLVRGEVEVRWIEIH